MTGETVKIRCWRIGGTPKAYLLAKEPKARDPKPKGIWFPRSQCEHVSVMNSEPGGWDEVVITMQEWIAAQKGLL